MTATRSGVLNDAADSPLAVRPRPPRGGGQGNARALRLAAWPVIVFWVLVVAAAGPLSTKLTGAQTNDATASLPAAAESTQVIREQQRFPGGQSVPTVAVYVRDSGLTRTDTAAIAAARDRLSPAAGDSPAPPVTRSRDGRAAMITVNVSAGDPTTLLADLETLKTSVGTGLPAGLTVALTGPGGQARDFADIGSGIDSTLLIVTVLTVAVLLLLTYRSPVLWLVPLLAVGVAVTLAQASIYLLTKAGLVIDAQGASILTVLVFGVGTDYALLLIARYREELHRHDDRCTAMAVALRRAAPAILASGATVALGLLCLLASDLTSNRSLGPVSAVGVICALAAMITLLPALLVVCGRWLFWPLVPRVGKERPAERGVWAKVAGLVGRHPRRIWIATTVLLAGLSLGMLGLQVGLSPQQAFTGRPESVVGQELLTRHFPAGSSAPVTIIANASAVDEVTAAAAMTPGVLAVRPQASTGGRTQLATTLAAADGPAAYSSVDALRSRVHAVPDADAVVGGQAASALDTRRATTHDLQLVVPLVLLVVLAVLGLLLRAVVAPLLLVATVVLSYTAALGLSALIDRHLLHHPGTDPSVPLFGFIFLVAVGVDYNIFLMSRVREESVRHGTRAGVLRGLTATGGVITSAGVVLAAVFAALGVLPLVQFVQIAVVVALGVLLDTLIVRSLLVPALTLELGRRTWWPSSLARPKEGPPCPPTPRSAPPTQIANSAPISSASS